MSNKTGPVYCVDLIETMPVSSDSPDGWQQAMPQRDELVRCRKHFERVVAAYEILLKNYMETCEALWELRDHQNGCPLPSYERGWNQAMTKTEKALEVYRGIEPKHE